MSCPADYWIAITNTSRNNTQRKRKSNEQNAVIMSTSVMEMGSYAPQNIDTDLPIHTMTEDEREDELTILKQVAPRRKHQHGTSRRSLFQLRLTCHGTRLDYTACLSLCLIGSLVIISTKVSGFSILKFSSTNVATSGRIQELDLSQSAETISPKKRTRLDRFLRNNNNIRHVPTMKLISSSSSTTLLPLPIYQNNSDSIKAISKCPFARFFRQLEVSERRDNIVPVISKFNGVLGHTSTSDSIIRLSDQSLPMYSTNINNLAATVLSVSTPTIPKTHSDWENNLVEDFEAKYTEALQLKCPFLRRRTTDILDATYVALRILFIDVLHRPESFLGPPPSLRCDDNEKSRACISNRVKCEKRFHLPIEELKDFIRQDWRTDSNTGYYITGKLNTAIYRNDCYFDGPDPDMPVRGLRKYLNAASQLFDQRTSRCELLSLDIITLPNEKIGSGRETDNRTVIQAKWKMNGTLRIPWRPILPTVTGTTIYYMDPTGLVERHVETWDISAYQAFFETFFNPESMQKAWDTAKMNVRIMFQPSKKTTGIDNHNSHSNY